jgi:type III pantothenate kinase
VNLVIDIGNTRAKIALFQQDTLVRADVLELTDALSLFRFLQHERPEKVMISSVIKEIPAFLEEYKATIPVLEFKSKSKIPLLNKYKSASTLGSDRMAAAVGAWKRYPGKDVLVIDSGTCIKYNMLNRAGEYLGGGISPGIDMRLKAMHVFTGRLPEVEANYDFDVLCGATTQDSLLSGALNGALAEVDGLINRYREQYSELLVVVTGGNYQFFEKRLKNRIFAHPNLVLEGLNEILAYNV